ncbi:MAG: hypothetical protein IJS57_06160 [Paludibacteraceae bacterium]|nr:hypothetical protein [Paludibacteraceae bacterium]
MKKMNISHNSKHFLNVLLLILMLVGMNTNVWGNDCKVIVGVGVGKGKAKVELWKHPITGHSKEAETGYVKNGEGTTEATKDIFRSTNAYAKYYADAATGYTFSGWHNNDASCSNTASGTSSPWSTDEIAAKHNPTFKYYAKFTPNSYTITLDNQSATSAGTTSISVTFDANTNLTSAISIPTKTGKVFDGYYTATNGNGTKIIDGNGNVLANAGTYTDASTNWVYANHITLYANWVNKLTPNVTSGKTTLSVDEQSEDAFTFVNTYGISWEIINTNISNSINNGDGQVIEYNASENKIIAHNAGSATIRFTQAETSSINAGVFEFNFTVNKRTPAFTWDGDVETNYTFNYFYNTTKANIFFTTGEVPYTVVSDNEFSAKVDEDNKLRVYNVAEDAHITVSQPENYKWNAHEKTYTIHPYNNANIHVPFTLSSGNHAGFEPAGAFSYAVWNGNGYRFGDDNPTDAEDGYAIIRFEGVPDKLYFDKSLETYVMLPFERMCIVYESANGIDWSPVWMNNEREETTNGNEVQLSATSRYIKFTYNGTINANYTNIRVTERNIFKITPEGMLNFGDQGLEYGEQAKTATFEHANAGRITNVEIKGADASYFTVSPTTIVGTGRDFYGIAHLDIRFDNMGENRGTTPYTARLVITDNAGRGDSIVLQARRFGKNRPEFTWNPNSLPYYFNSNIANVASSTNLDVPLTFSSSNESIAKVDENGILRIYNTGSEVTITVRQAANADFESGVASYTFTPRKRPDLSVPFQVTDNTFYTKHVQAGSKCKWDDGGIFLGGNNYLTDDWVWEHEGKNFVIEFAETPGKLSFTIQSGSILCTGTSHMWQVEESSTGVSGDWSTVWYYGYKETDGKTFSEIELKPSTRFLRFTYRGNYWGYFKNINVSELVGYKYLRAEQDGKYLSRGAKWGTQAVVGPFGIPCRISRYTRDNTNIYTRFLYLDNQQYLYEADNHELFTDDGTAANTDNMWKINNDGGILTIQSGNEVTDSHKGYYVTIDETNALALTNNVTLATQWRMEDYTEHASFITTMLDREASAAAAFDFGTDVNTLAKVRTQIKTNDFEKVPVDIPALALGEQTGEYRSGVAGTNAVYDQMVDTLKPGFYRLTVKAFYRTSPSTNAWKCHDEGKESVVAYVYANDVKYPIQSVYDSYQAQLDPSDELHEGHYYPATLTSADLAYDEENRYLNDVYVYVEADPGKTTGTLRYGIKNPSYVPGAWLAYEDITLTRISRKEYIFKGETVEGETTDWQIGGNWDRESQPTKNHAVYVQHDLIIDEEVEVYSLTIENDKSGNPVTVTIAPNGGLTVGAGGVRGASAEKLILKAGTAEDGALKGQTGYLRISPYSTQPMPEVTVELYTIGYYNMNVGNHQDVGTWQYVGSPTVNDGTLARNVFTKNMLYDWNEATGEWKNNLRRLVLQPFTGYATSQYKEEGQLVTTHGQLVDNGEVVLPLSYTESSATPGCNVFANSFTAPIDISKLEASDFSEGVDATIHLFNTGSKTDVAAHSSDSPEDVDINAAGQYLSIPVINAGVLHSEFGYPLLIPAMQGFYVNTDREGTLTLNYEKLVWNTNLTTNPNTPLRAPKKSNEEEEQTISGTLQVTLATDGMTDNLFLLEAEHYDASFENGYDARKKMSCAFNIFSVVDDEHLAVDATNSIIGTRVGVRTGDETAYTFVFGKVRSENELALLDFETNQTIDINEGTAYTFFAEPNSMIEDRFEIVERENVPAITTDIENVEKESKAHKFIKDGQLYILKNGILYNAMGAVVR